MNSHLIKEGFDLSLKYKSVAYSVPSQKVENDHLFSRLPSLNQGVVNDLLGLKERYYLGPGETIIDVGAEAAKQAIQKAKISPHKIDLIIVATWTPYRKVPSNACHIASRLGIDVMAFDISAACSGFIYASHIAAQFLNHKSITTALIIGMDCISKYIDPERKDCVFFGDAAGAAIVTRQTDDALNNFTKIYSGGNPESFYLEQGNAYFHMNARAILEHATHHLPRSVEKVLKQKNLGFDDIKIVIPHQPSRHLLKTVFEKMGFGLEKVFINVEKFGNTSAATIPIALTEALEQGLINDGDLVLFVSIGAGMTWSVSLHYW